MAHVWSNYFGFSGSGLMMITSAPHALHLTNTVRSPIASLPSFHWRKHQGQMLSLPASGRAVAKTLTE
jgi:hypothetical protein